MLTFFFKKLAGGKFLLLLIAIHVSLITFLSAQEIEWQNTIGGGLSEEKCFIQQTSDGGYIIGGGSESNISGDKTENSMGDFDYWIVKIDSIGNIQWQNTIGGSNSDKLQAISQTTDGGYIVGGHSLSHISGDKTEICIGLGDYWILKIDSWGNIQWQNTIGGGSYDELSSIQQTLDGGYIIGGSSSSGISLDKSEPTVGLNGNYDYWIVKTDWQGNIVWQNTIGGNGDDLLTSLGKTADGGYILGGYSKSNISGDKTENSLGGLNYGDYWIVKIDSIGNVQWDNTIGGNRDDILNSIEQTSDGGYVIGGRSLSSTSYDKTENNLDSTNATSDFWIVKTDSVGNIFWQNTIGGDDTEWLYYIKQTNDGGYMIGGNTSSDISGDKSEKTQGDQDIWVLKLDLSGNIQWQNSIGGNDWDGSTSFQQTTDGGFVLGGGSCSDISGDKTENSIGSSSLDCSDYWVLKLNGEYNLISGKAFLDLNSNSTYDTGEPSVKNKKITETNTTRFAFSQPNGFYNVGVLDSGNFSVSPASINYYAAAPVSHNATFSGGFQQTDSLNDFAFQPLGTFNDLCLTITSLNNLRQGRNANYLINYVNVGTTTLNGTVKIYPDNVLSYVSSSQTPVSVNTDSVVWNVGTLAPFQSGIILATFLVSTTAPIGSVTNSSAQIEPIINDANTACNIDTATVTITGSYDPNDILVSEDTLTTTQLATQPFLDYTIRFQNTGNDTAFTVKIINPIDTNRLNLQTIELLNSSYPVNAKWIPYNKNMEFLFENILLPDSNINEPQSHGFVTYRIKPKTTLLAGYSITNKAYIYFDFNAPVETNTAITRIVLPTGISNWSNQSNGVLKVYPNPANDEVTIESLQGAIGSEIKLYNVYGKLVLEDKISSANCKLSIGKMEPGVYFISINSQVQKLIKL